MEGFCRCCGANTHITGVAYHEGVGAACGHMEDAGRGGSADPHTAACKDSRIVGIGSGQGFHVEAVLGGGAGGIEGAVTHIQSVTGGGPARADRVGHLGVHPVDVGGGTPGRHPVVNRLASQAIDIPGPGGNGSGDRGGRVKSQDSVGCSRGGSQIGVDTYPGFGGVACQSQSGIDTVVGVCRRGGVRAGEVNPVASDCRSRKVGREINQLSGGTHVGGQGQHRAGDAG